MYSATGVRSLATVESHMGSLAMVCQIGDGTTIAGILATTVHTEQLRHYSIGAADSCPTRWSIT